MIKYIGLLIILVIIANYTIDQIEPFTNQSLISSDSVQVLELILNDIFTNKFVIPNNVNVTKSLIIKNNKPIFTKIDSSNNILVGDTFINGSLVVNTLSGNENNPTIINNNNNIIKGNTKIEGNLKIKKLLIKGENTYRDVFKEIDDANAYINSSIYFKY